MDVDVKLSFEVFCNPIRCPARGVFSFIGRISFQEGLDFLFDLLGNFLRASVPLSVIQP